MSLYLVDQMSRGCRIYDSYDMISSSSALPASVVVRRPGVSPTLVLRLSFARDMTISVDLHENKIQLNFRTVLLKNVTVIYMRHVGHPASLQ